jgi:hypothetical protein
MQIIAMQYPEKRAQLVTFLNEKVEEIGRHDRALADRIKNNYNSKKVSNKCNTFMYAAEVMSHFGIVQINAYLTNEYIDSLGNNDSTRESAVNSTKPTTRVESFQPRKITILDREEFLKWMKCYVFDFEAISSEDAGAKSHVYSKFKDKCQHEIGWGLYRPDFYNLIHENQFWIDKMDRAQTKIHNPDFSWEDFWRSYPLAILPPLVATGSVLEYLGIPPQRKMSDVVNKLWGSKRFRIARINAMDTWPGCMEQFFGRNSLRVPTTIKDGINCVNDTYVNINEIGREINDDHAAMRGDIADRTHVGRSMPSSVSQMQQEARKRKTEGAPPGNTVTSSQRQRHGKEWRGLHVLSDDTLMRRDTTQPPSFDETIDMEENIHGSASISIPMGYQQFVSHQIHPNDEERREAEATSRENLRRRVERDTRYRTDPNASVRSENLRVKERPDPREPKPISPSIIQTPEDFVLQYLRAGDFHSTLDEKRFRLESNDTTWFEPTVHSLASVVREDFLNFFIFDKQDRSDYDSTIYYGILYNGPYQFLNSTWNTPITANVMQSFDKVMQALIIDMRKTANFTSEEQDRIMSIILNVMRGTGAFRNKELRLYAILSLDKMIERMSHIAENVRLDARERQNARHIGLILRHTLLITKFSWDMKKDKSSTKQAADNRVAARRTRSDRTIYYIDININNLDDVFEVDTEKLRMMTNEEYCHDNLEPHFRLEYWMAHFLQLYPGNGQLRDRSRAPLVVVKTPVRRGRSDGLAEESMQVEPMKDDARPKESKDYVEGQSNSIKSSARNGGKGTLTVRDTETKKDEDEDEDEDEEEGENDVSEGDDFLDDHQRVNPMSHDRNTQLLMEQQLQGSQNMEYADEDNENRADMHDFEYRPQKKFIIHDRDSDQDPVINFNRPPPAGSNPSRISYAEPAFRVPSNIDVIMCSDKEGGSNHDFPAFLTNIDSYRKSILSIVKPMAQVVNRNATAKVRVKSSIKKKSTDEDDEDEDDEDEDDDDEDDEEEEEEEEEDEEEEEEEDEDASEEENEEKAYKPKTKQHPRAEPKPQSKSKKPKHAPAERVTQSEDGSKVEALLKLILEQYLENNPDKDEKQNVKFINRQGQLISNKADLEKNLTLVLKLLMLNKDEWHLEEISKKIRGTNYLIRYSKEITPIDKDGDHVSLMALMCYIPLQTAGIPKLFEYYKKSPAKLDHVLGPNPADYPTYHLLKWIKNKIHERSTSVRFPYLFITQLKGVILDTAGENIKHTAVTIRLLKSPGQGDSLSLINCLNQETGIECAKNFLEENETIETISMKKKCSLLREALKKKKRG